MDPIVEAALKKWPNVPHCYGWLALDARGEWYMRDDRVQAAGPFPRSKGSRLTHDKLIAFIHRNYACDGQGQWFFQNGPQRVYVDLEDTPLVWRLQPDGRVVAHTGEPAQVREVLLDETGRLYLDCDIGVGLVHTADMALAADAVEAGRWAPVDVRHADAQREQDRARVRRVHLPLDARMLRAHGRRVRARRVHHGRRARQLLGHQCLRRRGVRPRRRLLQEQQIVGLGLRGVREGPRRPG